MQLLSALTALSILGLLGCVGPGHKADLPLDKRFPRQQVTLVLGNTFGTYICYVDHEQQSLYLCQEVIKK